MNNKSNHIKQTGFRVPENYFNNLEDSVFTKLNAKSKLDSVNDSGFSTPQDYFSKIEETVFNKLNEEKKDAKIVQLFSKQNLIYFSGIAAAIIILISVFKPSSSLSFDTIETELVESYISTHDIYSEDLASLWNESDYSDVSFTEFELLDESVENYILENSNIEDLLID